MSYSARNRLHPYANGYRNPYVVPRPVGAAIPPVVNPPLGARQWFVGTRNELAGPLTSVANGRLGTLSFWFKNELATSGQPLSIGSSFPTVTGFQIKNFSSDQMQISMYTVGVDDKAIDFTVDWTAAGAGWNHIMLSWEHVLPANIAVNITGYLNGVLQVNGVAGAIIAQGSVDDDIKYNDDIAQGDSVPAGFNWKGCLAEFYLNFEERIDFTDQLNREKFYNAGDAVIIGGDGSSVTGSQPAFYASNGELNPNAGKSDNIPVTAGEVLNCIDAPDRVPGLYTAFARDYDGATKNRISGLPSGVTDGRVGTFSCWVKLHDIVSQQTLIHYSQIPAGAQGGLCRFAVGTQGMKLILNLFNTSAQTGLTMGHQGGMLLNTWHHVMYSWDNAFPVDAANNLTGYFDGAVVVDGVGGANMSQSNSDFDLAYATKGTEYTEGQRSSNFDGFQPNHLDGCVSNLYFNIDERIDLTVLANREKFRLGAAGQANGLPVYLGADGSLPSGSQPAFYAENGELVANAGYASNLPVIQGAVTDCADAPS